MEFDHEPPERPLHCKLWIMYYLIWQSWRVNLCCETLKTKIKQEWIRQNKKTSPGWRCLISLTEFCQPGAFCDPNKFCLANHLGIIWWDRIQFMEIHGCMEIHALIAFVNLCRYCNYSNINWVIHNAWENNIAFKNRHIGFSLLILFYGVRRIDRLLRSVV